MKNKIWFVVSAFAMTTWLAAQADLAKITGKYFAADGIEFENMLKMKKKQKEDLELKFIGEESGKIQNKLNMKWKGGSVDAYLDEKLYNKNNIVWFKASEFGFILIAPEVLAIVNSSGDKVGDVLVKDKNKLKDYDMDTAKAMIDDLMGQLTSSASDERKQKLMKYKAYKENVGKVVFAENNRLFYSPYGVPEEDPASYIKSITIGRNFAMQAFMDVNPYQKYGKTSEINIEYEFEGKKFNRKDQAKLSRGWSNTPKIDPPNDYYFLSGRTVVLENKLDYTFIYTILQSRNKLVAGKSYPLKVTFYAYKDGANVAKLAEGTISLKYEADSEKALNTWQEYIDDL